MRTPVLVLAAALLALAPSSAESQNRVRVHVDGGQQVTETPFEQNLNFQQYLEQGSLRFERPVPKVPFFDAGVAVRLAGALHVGGTISYFTNTRAGTVTADVPHPLYFTELRTVTANVQSTARKEMAGHIQLSWTAPAAGGIEFTFFGGPSIFMSEQSYVKGLTLSLSDEVYPFDALAFPGVSTATFEERIIGYNGGVDLTWRFGRHTGVGMLIRYSSGKKNVTPTGADPIDVEVGGLHAGGGLRFIF